MDMTHSYWEDNTQRVKFERCLTNEEPVSRLKDDRAMYPCCDSNLNFSTATCSEDDSEYGQYKKSKVARQDPMSHRIIEKRRRDRMNNCLADLSRLIPTDYLKKGRGRIEKTEIIEMAIKHMKHLQSQDRGNPVEHYRLGYQECMSEAMRFMVEVEGHFPREPMVVRLLNHLQKHGEQICNTPTPMPQEPPFAHVPVKNEMPPAARKVNEMTVPKAEPENSNSNDAHFVVKPIEDKDVGGASYKYKTNIKLRFNQDLNAHEVPKRQKLDERRSSVTSFENHSSNQSSPPSEPSRISEPDLQSQSPDAKQDTPRPDSLLQLSPTPQEPNFNIPIFVLHTKGSYYVPLTIDYKTLRPFLQSFNLMETNPQTVLHPVTINVNFLPVDLKKYRYEYNNNWH